MNISKTCDDFLLKYGMHHKTLDMPAEIEKFRLDMINGLQGKKASMLMLPAYIPMDIPLTYDQPVIVMDAGGTNLRVAVVTFLKDSEPKIEHFQNYSMPGTQGEISKSEFFAALVDTLVPVLDYSPYIGLCFSFAVEIQPDLDGKILFMSKEAQITDINNSFIRKEINEELKSRGLTEKKLVVFNDTITALLGGYIYPDADNFGGHIGFILGTGTNTAYGEKISNINKIDTSTLSYNVMAINTESCAYNGIPQGALDKKLDAQTVNPGTWLFEKMISGAYQLPLVKLLITQAVEDGILSDSVKNNMSLLNQLQPWDLDSFLRNTNDNPLSALMVNADDRQFTKELLHSFYMRIAKLVTINIAAVIQQIGVGADPNHPVAVTVEGSTFHKSPIFLEKLDTCTVEFLNNKMGIYCKYLKIENVNILGSAVAGLIASKI